MPAQLPDCSRCDAAGTLSAVRVEPRGVRVCVCSCCSSVVRVDEDGAVIHEVDVSSDVNGVPMFDP